MGAQEAILNLSTLLLIDQTKEEINLLCRMTATNIFGGFLGTGGAY